MACGEWTLKLSTFEDLSARIHPEDLDQSEGRFRGDAGNLGRL